MAISKLQPMRPALDACIDAIDQGFDPYIEEVTKATEAATEAAEAANLAREDIQTDLAAKADKTGTYSTLTSGGTTPDSVTDAMLVQTGGVLDAVDTFELSSTNYDFGFMFGGVNSDGVIYFPRDVYTRIRSYYIPVYDGDIFTVGNAGPILSVHLFDYNGSYVGQLSAEWTDRIIAPSDGLAVVMLRKANDGNITSEEIAGIGANLRLISGGAACEVRLRRFMKQNNLLDAVVWDSRYYNQSSGTWDFAYSRAGAQSIIRVENDMFVTPSTDYNIAYGLYTGSTVDVSELISKSGWLSGETFVPANSNLYLLVRKSDNSSFKAYEVYDNIKLDAFKAEPYKAADVTWTKGITSADGTISYVSNGAVSQIIAMTKQVQLSDSVRAVVLLYSGLTYLGKINANGGIDKEYGNWRYFTGNINMTSYFEEFGADSMRICIMPTDNTTITGNTVQTYGDNNCIVVVEKFVSHEWLVENYASLQVGNGSVTGADFVKRGVKTTLLGTLSKKQAFCVYGGKYYSTSGTELAVQDLAFNVEQTVSLNLGHGNSLQLGSNGIAYASGWDDNKVYAVDLSTLTITDTYILPTTGYTTVAVDDVNEVMYIFQRDSYPTTVETYNFIAYDYANNNVLSTRKVKAFAAMQACDYYEGRIIVSYGFGVSAAPSGMFICNTAGDILAEYDLDVMASKEPEGVCYDRESGILLVSDAYGQTYRLTSA